MPELIAKVYDDLEVWRCDLDELQEQRKNARTMAPETFNRLVSNIQKDGGKLEALPLCHRLANGDIAIISGHHRVRAARSAGVSEWNNNC